MKTILTSLFILFTFVCSGQITKTEEVKNNFDREIAHIKELFRAEMEALRKALELQAKEYERRLDILNGEAEQLRDMQAKYVPRETFEAFQKQVMGDTEANKSDLIKLNSWKSTIVGQLAILGTIFMVAMALLNHFKPFAKKEQKPTT